MINQVHDLSMALLPVDTDSRHNRQIIAPKEPIEDSYTAKTYLYDAGKPDHWGTSELTVITAKLDSDCPIFTNVAQHVSHVVSFSACNDAYDNMGNNVFTNNAPPGDLDAQVNSTTERKIHQPRHTDDSPIDNPMKLLQEEVATAKDFSYHLDALGSVRSLTDADGATAVSYKYTPYGEMITTDGSDNDAKTNHTTYTARDYETSFMMFYRSRFYGNRMGRFSQKVQLHLGDSISNDTPLLLNFYIYKTGNPLDNRTYDYQYESSNNFRESFSGDWSYSGIPPDWYWLQGIRTADNIPPKKEWRISFSLSGFVFIKINYTFVHQKIFDPHFTNQIFRKGMNRISNTGRITCNKEKIINLSQELQIPEGYYFISPSNIAAQNERCDSGDNPHGHADSNWSYDDPKWCYTMHACGTFNSWLEERTISLSSNGLRWQNVYSRRDEIGNGREYRDCGCYVTIPSCDNNINGATCPHYYPIDDNSLFQQTTACQQ